MHYFAIAIVPKPIPHSDKKQIDEHVKSHVSLLMAPYSENLSTEEHDERCYCVGGIARDAADKAADSEVGTFVAMRDKYDAMKRDDQEAADKAWATFIEQRSVVEKVAFDKHPDRETAELDCDECHGSGVVKSTRNPKGHWDWYQIGGRWTGVLTGYDPEKDPRNKESCWLCQGTGRRDDERAREWRAANPAYTCNGCNGTGIALKWPTHWQNEGNVTPVSELVGNDDRRPYAVVLPDGSWHAKETWDRHRHDFDNKPADEWRAEFEKLIAPYADTHVAVVVDYHS